ncbi:MAG: hypothetical protein ACF8XB_23975 [Planctomycetota bacterium JB042]
MRLRPAPLLVAGALAALSLAAVGEATAQPPSPPAPRVASIPLEPPAVELGEEFVDEESGFLFRLPVGMALVPPAELDAWRNETLVPEDQLPMIDGKRARVGGWLFRHPDGGSIFVLMNEPPVSIDSPTQLRQALAAENQAKGRPYEDHGKLYEFKARGARAGFLVTRDFGLEPGKPMQFRQHAAYLRGPDRSFLIRYTAPVEDFDRLGDAFQASMVTFAIERGTRAPVVSSETPPKAPALGSARSLGNLALLVLIVVGGLFWWKRSSGGAPEGA